MSVSPSANRPITRPQIEGSALEAPSFEFSGITADGDLWSELKAASTPGHDILKAGFDDRIENGGVTDSPGGDNPVAAPTVSLTTEQAGAQISRGNYGWNGDQTTFPQGTTLTYGFRESSIIGPPDTSGFQQFTAPMIQAAVQALKSWQDVSGLNFTATNGTNYSNSGTILFGQYDEGLEGAEAFAWKPDADPPFINNRNDEQGDGDVWYNSGNAAAGGPTYFNVWGYGFSTLVHEIGHALGLDHPGDYSALDESPPNYNDDAEYIEDTYQYSVMSYFDETSANGANHGDLELSAPMMDDISAIQRMYGVPTDEKAFGVGSTNPDSGLSNLNTVYGWNSNTGRAWFTETGNELFISQLVFCAYDKGGNDTFDFSGYTQTQNIYLQGGRNYFSDVGGLTKNVSIYEGVTIENAKGGSGTDTIQGNNVDNKLDGNGGNDSLSGFSGNDTLKGGDGLDVISGSDDDDSILGGEGSDSLFGGNGADQLFGGPATATGTDFDTITGDAGNDTIDGGDLGDTIDGGADDDSLKGGAGADAIQGGTQNDKLFGEAGADTLQGGDGNDTLEGGTDGAIDSLIGGIGDDVYEYRAGAIIVETTGQGVDTVRLYITNTIIGYDFVEHVDVMVTTGISAYGDSRANTITSGAGSDLLDGNGGVDSLVGAAGNDTLDGGAGADRLEGGADNDSYIYDAADTINDSSGVDAIVVSSPVAGNLVDLNDVDIVGIEGITALDGAGAINLTGNGVANLLTGNASNNQLVGNEGDDTLTGGGGDDTLNGGAGFDKMDGGAATDTALYDFVVSVNWDIGTSRWMVGSESLVDIERVRMIASNFLLVDNVANGGFASGAAALAIAQSGDTVQYRTGWNTDILTVTVNNLTFSADATVTGLAYTLANGVISLTMAGMSEMLAIGNASNNIITGNDAANTLTGAAGADTLIGAGGNDIYRIEGGDLINDTSGSDTVEVVGAVTGNLVDLSSASRAVGNIETILAYADAGAVSLTGTSTANTITGNNSANTLRGLDGADTITGAGGADSIDGGAANDGLNGGVGNDTLVSGTGFDSLVGDVDNDVLVVSTGSRSTVSGGTGDDVLQIDWSAPNERFFSTAPTSGAEGYSGEFYWQPDSGNGSHNNAVYSGIDRFQVTMGGQDDQIRTGDGIDTINAGAGNDIIWSRAGADNINGGANGVGGSDVWIANLAGADAATLDLTQASSNYSVGAQNGSVTGVEQLGINNGTDVFQTGSGNDTIVTLGGFFHDFINTGDGRDWVKVAGGRDRVEMGTHSGVGDVLEVDWSAPGEEFWSTALGGSAAGYSGEIYWRPDGGNGSHNNLTFSGVERFKYTFGAHNDQLVTGDNADTIKSGGGNDIVWSGAGLDDVDGEAGNDIWVADKSASNQAMTITLGAVSTYKIVSGAAFGTVSGIEQLGMNDGGSNAFITGSADDVITTTGGFFQDRISTNAGADTVKIAGGRDRVDMGAQAGAGDLLEVNWSGVTEEFWSTGLTADTLNGTGYSGTIYWRPDGDNGDRNRVDFSGVERFKLTLGSHNDRLITGDNNDTVDGGAGNDILFTSAGVDDVNGGANAVGASDSWVADKSASSVNMLIDLTAASSTYRLVSGGQLGTVQKIEQLGLNDGVNGFSTGSGDDTITTLSGFFNERILTNGGADTVKVAGGRDFVDLGGGGGAGDLLIVDWSYVTEQFVSGTQTLDANGYNGVFYWAPDGDNGERNRVDYRGVERFDVTLGSHNDHLRTGDNADTVKGGGGNDILWTGAGVDIIEGGASAVDAADIWVADKSASTVAMTINLAGASSYQLVEAGPLGSVTQIEQLGINDGGPNGFSTGSGNDTITTLGGFWNDRIATNAGLDSVKIAGGRDRIDMGGQTGLGDLLIIDWTSSSEQFVSGTQTLDANGYNGVFYWAPDGDNGSRNRVDYTGVERFNVTMAGGHDRIVTGNNADTVSAGAGDDIIWSGGGADSIVGGANSVDLGGNPTGSDSWVANKSAATLAMTINLAALSTYTIGGIGGSVVGIEQLGLNDGGSNAFETGSGADSITTLSAFFNERIQTNGGADTVFAGGGRDRIDMGGQTGLGDLLIVNWSYVTEQFVSNPFTLDTVGGTGYSGVYFWGPDGDNGSRNRVSFTGVERFDITMGSHSDRIYTGDNADTVSGGLGDDSILSGKGIDVVNGGGGIDLWVADKSFATAAQAIVLDLTLNSLQTYLTTGSVRFIDWVNLTTGAGADVITTRGDFLHDTVTTGDGDDTVKVAGGRDIVSMGDQGSGVDLLVLDWSSVADTFVSYWNAADGDGFNGGYFWGPDGGHGGRNRVDFTGVDAFDLTFGGGGDNIRTGDKADTVRSGAGNDVINTGRGDDFVDAGGGDDHWIADKFYAADDIEINLQKVGFSTYLTTGAVRGVESMQFVSGSGADKLTTGLGFFNDHITTRAGNDVVTVAGGRDFVDMGAAGGKGDRLIVDWSATGDQFTMHAPGTDATGHNGVLFWGPDGGNGSRNRVDFVGVERFNIKLGSGSDNVTTGAGADTISGANGNDVLSGDLGNDRLFGGADVDTLNGGDGGDILDGGLGQDFLTGGAGGDTFAYTGLADSATAARDVIADLDDALDRLDLSKIDANTGVADDQKFTKVAAFTGNAGQLVVSAYDAVNNWTLVQGDVDGDGLADFAIQLTGDHDTFNQFVL